MKNLNILDRVAPLANDLANSFCELVLSEFGSVKDKQHYLARGLFAGTLRTEDENGKPLVHNEWTDGLLSMSASERFDAIVEERIVEQAYSGFMASVGLMIENGDYSEEQEKLFLNRGRQMFGPLQNIAQVLAYGSEEDRTTIEECFNHGASADTKPSFSNLASVAKTIKTDLVANSDVSFSKKISKISVTFSASQLKKLYTLLDRLTKKVDTLKGQIMEMQCGIFRAYDKQNCVIMNANTIKANMIQNIKNLSDTEIATMLQEQKSRELVEAETSESD